MSETRIKCPEKLDHDSGRDLHAAVLKQRIDKGATLIVDFAGTDNVDSLGGAWLVKIAGLMHLRKGELVCEGHSGAVAEFVEMIRPGFQHTGEDKIRHEGLLEELGGRAFKYTGELKDFFGLLVDSIYWTLIAPFEGRGFRWGLFMDELYEMGVRGVRINTLMNFLLGLIIAMLSAAQIAPYGLGIFVADLIVIAFARELSAIMTATVVSARTGAAIAAELATMEVQEEIDALRGMGLNVPQFLVAPKIAALVVVMPCLVAIGMVAGVLGGSVWGILVLGYRPEAWFRETLAAAYTGDIMQGMLKALVFAVMIVLIGCHNGFRVTGGSRGVGLMTTRAVVMDIFFIIVIDMLFAVMFYYYGFN